MYPRASLPGLPSPYCGEYYLSRLLLPDGRLQMTFQHAFFKRERIPLGPIALVNWAPVTDVPTFWALFSLHLSYQWPKVVVCQLLPPQGLSVPAISSGNSHYLYPFVVSLLFHLLAVGALLGAWASGKVVCVGMTDALTVIGCEIVLL